MAQSDYEVWARAQLPGLLRFAYLVTGSREAAQDAVQSALTNAYAAWDRVAAQGEAAAYVQRAVVNAHISSWRRFGKRQQPVADPPDSAHADIAERVVEQDAVWRMCASLPPQQRAAVVLRFYEDLNYPQIAAVLDCTPATARSHIHRALSRLRTELAFEDH